MYKAVENRIRKALKHHIHERYKTDVPVSLERPPKLAMGEVASPLCFELAKQLRKPPRALAQEIANSLKKIEGVARTEVAGGGYLNFFFDRGEFFRAACEEASGASGAKAPDKRGNLMSELKLRPPKKLAEEFTEGAEYGNSGIKDPDEEGELQRLKPPSISSSDVAAKISLTDRQAATHKDSQVIGRDRDIQSPKLSREQLSEGSKGRGGDEKKTIVEHTSINPNKAAHIGHVRNAVLGDTFARLLRHAGRHVEVQNYIDNTGVQVADVVLGFLYIEKKSIEEVKALAAAPAADEPSSAEPAGARKARFDYLCWDLYARVTQFLAEDKSRLELRDRTLKEIEEGHGDAAKMGEVVGTAIVHCHLRTLDRLGIDYDLLTRESEILQLKFWDAAFEMLKQRGAIELATSGKNAGCWVMQLPSGRGAAADSTDASGAKAPDPGGSLMSELKLRPPKLQHQTQGELKPADPAGRSSEIPADKLRPSEHPGGAAQTGELPAFAKATAGNPAGGSSQSPAEGADENSPEESAEETEAKIIVRSTGTVTYVGKDIALHLWKFGLLDRDFHYRRFHKHPDGHEAWVTASDRDDPGAPAFGRAHEVFNVIDSRQAYPQQVVVAGLRALGYNEEADHLKHFAYNVVALTPRCARELGYEIPAEDAKKQYVDVSGRKGQGVKADDLLDRLEAGARAEVDSRHPDTPESERAAISHAIAIGALRYFLLRFTRSTVIAFDFEDALSFEGETGPYVQYAVVRVNGILRKGAELEPSVGAENAENTARLKSGALDVSKFLSGAEGDDLWDLVLLAGSLDARLDGAVSAQEPAFLARFAFELAQAFNVFYHKHHILSEKDAEKRAFLLLITALVREQLVTALGLMGITAPEKM